MKKILFLFFLLPLLTNAQIITTVAGNGSSGYSGDGSQATGAQMGPTGVAVDVSGNIYIADAGNNCIRKVNTSGIITTIAGNGYGAGSGGITGGYNGDNIPATSAELYYPMGVTVDISGNVYIADYENHRVRKVNTSGVITTIAGTGIIGQSGDGGPATAAELGSPEGVTMDVAGNIYVADNYGNNSIRKIDVLGTISTVAGGGSNDPGNGLLATSAYLVGVQNVSVDNVGNIYFAEGGNQIVCKVNTAGILSIVAGKYGTAGYNSDGIAATDAKLNGPIDVALDKLGNLYITEFEGHRLRLVDTSGIISTIAGIGTAGYNGDGIGAFSAKLSYPYGLAIDIFGDIYIGDGGNKRVRLIKMDTTVLIKSLTLPSEDIKIYPNPASTTLTICSSTPIITVALLNICGQHIISSYHYKQEVQVDIADLPAGVYYISINGSEVRKFCKQ